MSTFHDLVASDIENEFFDLDIFGETHEFGSRRKSIICVIDEDVFANAVNAGDLGLTAGNCVLYAKETDIDRQTEGTNIEIDGRIYTVVDWRVDMGVHRVTLTRPQTYGW